MSPAIIYTTHEGKYFRVKAFTTSSSGHLETGRVFFDTVHETVHSYVLVKPRLSKLYPGVQYPGHLIHTRLYLFFGFFCFNMEPQNGNNPAVGWPCQVKEPLVFNPDTRGFVWSTSQRSSRVALDNDSIWQEVGKDFPLKGDPLDVSPQTNASGLRLVVPETTNEATTLILHTKLSSQNQSRNMYVKWFVHQNNLLPGHFSNMHYIRFANLSWKKPWKI